MRMGSVFKQFASDKPITCVLRILHAAGCAAALLAVQDGARATGLGVSTDRDARDLVEMSIEELSQLVVTSVSKRPEQISHAPAAVYVITREDIRRAGVTSLPEALRLAPGVEVARDGAHSWVISMRGFNRDITNKLLVLIDGRSVYSPLYAGVFWDVQDTLLEDIDRIEVVAGPGGTLWGANAVNGVINILTRSARDTVGTIVEAGGGREEQAFAGVRYGRKLGEEGAARIYLKSFSRDAARAASGQDAQDAWHFVQGGLRADWQTAHRDTFTLQGDAYRGREFDILRGDFTLGSLPGINPDNTIEVSGANVLGRWERPLERDANVRLQMYFDRTARAIPGTFEEVRETADVDFQHDLRAYGRHDVLWGAGMRVSRDRLHNTTFATFDPARRTDPTYSAFLQDKIELRPQRLYLTLGSKFEHNDYTGYEYQPSGRLAWTPNERHMLWTAASRAVRIPARLDTDLRLLAPVSLPGLPLPLYVGAAGNRQFDAEDLLAYEAGYRIRPRDTVSLDFAVFDNHYDRLQTLETLAPVVAGNPPYILLPAILRNGMKGRSRGGTLAAQWQPVASWRMQFQYTHLDLDLRLKAGSNDGAGPLTAGNSPENQLALHSYLDFGQRIRLYTGVRRVERLPNLGVPAYTAVDLSLQWRPRDDFDAALTVRNLTEARHLEFDAGAQIERAVYLRFVWYPD